MRISEAIQLLTPSINVLVGYQLFALCARGKRPYLYDGLTHHLEGSSLGSSRHHK